MVTGRIVCGLQHQTSLGLVLCIGSNLGLKFGRERPIIVLHCITTFGKTKDSQTNASSN